MSDQMLLTSAYGVVRWAAQGRSQTASAGEHHNYVLPRCIETTVGRGTYSARAFIMQLSDGHTTGSEEEDQRLHRRKISGGSLLFIQKEIP